MKSKKRTKFDYWRLTKAAAIVLTVSFFCFAVSTVGKDDGNTSGLMYYTTTAGFVITGLLVFIAMKILAAYQNIPLLVMLFCANATLYGYCLELFFRKYQRSRR